MMDRASGGRAPSLESRRASRSPRFRVHHPEDSFYSDKIVKSKLLNGFIFWINIVVVFLYRNISNLALQSKATIATKQIYRNIMLGRQAWRSAERSQSVPYNQLDVTYERLLRIEAAQRHKTGAAAHEIEDEEQGWIGTYSKYLRVPKRSSVILSFVLILDLVLITRYAVGLYTTRPQAPTKPVISCTKLLRGLRPELIFRPSGGAMVAVETGNGGGGRHERSSSPQTSSRVGFESVVSPTESGSGCELNQSFLEAYIQEKYDGFCLWRLTSNENYPEKLGFLKNWVFLEETAPLQLYMRESRVIMYIMASFLIQGGVILTIQSHFEPYDILPVLFLCEPKFVTFLIHDRLNCYIDLVRSSYLNFWSLYELSPDERLTVRRSFKRRTIGGGGGGGAGEIAPADKHTHSTHSSSRATNSSPPPNVVDCFNLTHKQFEDYMPRARRESWRMGLMIIQAILSCFAVLSITLGLLTLILYYIYLNSTAVKLNAEVKRLLEGHYQSEKGKRTGIESLAFDDLVIGTSPECAKNLTSATEQLGQFIAQLLVQVLGATDPEALSEIRTLTQRNGAAAAATTTTTNNNNPHDDARALARAIMPTEMPSAWQWSIVVLSITDITILISLYLVVFMVSLSDLCLWLVELQMKLNIYTIVLKHYQAISVAFHDRRANYCPVTPGSGGGGDIEHEESVGPWMRDLRRPTLEALHHRQRHHLALPPPPPPSTPEFTGRGHHQQSGWGRGGASTMMIQLQDDAGHYAINSEAAQMVATDGTTTTTIVDDFQHPPLDNDDFESYDANGEHDDDSPYNIGLYAIYKYLVSSRTNKRLLCERHAYRLIKLDLMTNISPRRTTEKFFLSTYLDFRLFKDEIDMCRKTVDTVISCAVLHGVNILAASTNISDINLKLSYILGGLILSNVALLGISFFQSQCSKLHNPIYSVLAASNSGDKKVRHLALLWRKYLTDLSGQRSMFAFKVYTVKITYATTLQFNLSIASLIILFLDKTQ